MKTVLILLLLSISVWGQNTDPVIWLQNNDEAKQEWQNFLKSESELNHYSVSVGKNQKENSKRISAIIEEVLRTTGKKPILIGHSTASKLEAIQLESVKGIIELSSNESPKIDHNRPVWFVWSTSEADSCAHGACAFDELVHSRVNEYISKTPVLRDLTGFERQMKIDELTQDVLERKFPAGFTPIYGTAFDNSDHLGRIAANSENARILGGGLRNMAKDHQDFSVPRTVRFKISIKDGVLGCATDAINLTLDRTRRKIRAMINHRN